MKCNYTLFIMLDNKVYKATINKEAIVSIGRFELPILGFEYCDEYIELSTEDARRYNTCTLSHLDRLQQAVESASMVIGGVIMSGLSLGNEL